MKHRQNGRVAVTVNGRYIELNPMKTQCFVVTIICALSLCSLRAADDLPHPILSISSNNGSSANTVTNTWTEAQYTNSFTPRYGPRNEGDGFGANVVSGDTGWSWSSSNPTNITSTPSGTILPANTGYQIQTQAVVTFTGQTNFAPYYFKSGSTSSKSFVFNVISYHQLGKRDGDFGNLMGAYVNTGLSQANRDNYARRIAIELLDWARWYPTYTLTAKNSASFISTGTNYILDQDRQLASDHNGLAHEWTDTPLKAFDAIYDSAVLTNMNAEMGFNVRDYITTNIFFFEGDFFVNHVPVQVAIDSNLSGPYDVLPEVARVLNRPDYIEWMDQYLDATVTQKVRRDGALEEGMGYSIGYLNANVTAAINTKNYFLTRPATNSEFIGISNRSVEYAAALQYGQAQWAAVALPNGQLPPFGDTPFNTYFSARNNGNSWMLPAYGTVSMGAGTSSSTAVQVNENFPGDNNHMRSDMAAFSLWAFNNEYLGNIRYYNGAIGRNWGEQITEKNDVTIDRVDETPHPDADTYGNGNLNLYEPGNNGLAMTEVDGYRGYSSKASRFQRILLLNTVDLSKPYMVDVFRITGGTNHDYTFHGSVRWTQTGQCSFPLVTNNNLYPMLEPGDAAWDLSSDTPYYGFFRGMSSNTAPGNFYLTFTDTNRSSARDTRLWMTADPNTYNVYVGWTPVPARDNTVPTNFFNSLGLTRASAIIRHRVSSGPLQDLFVSVVEPFNAGASNIVSVTRLPMSGGSLESCGLQVTFKDGRVDTYIVNLHDPKVAGASAGSTTVSTSDGQYSLTGRVGLQVDRTTGGDPRVWTMDATDFKYSNRELSTPSATDYSGWIAGSTREEDGAAYDAFTTTTPLPTGTVLRNKYLSLTHGKLSSGTTNISEMFKIDQVVLSNGLYYVCFTNDHFLEITNGVTSREQVAPQRSFTTSNYFEIALTAFAGQISPIADRNIPPGSSSGPISFSFGNLGTTSGSSLQIAATSSNQTLVPNSNLVIGGSGTNRTLTITPAAGQTGASIITVSVTDGTWTNSRSFNVNVGNFGIATFPASQSVLTGNSVNYTNIVSATNGTGTVGFSVSGLPTGATAGFNPATVTDTGTNVLTVTTSVSTPGGSYPLTITAVAGSHSASNIVTLVVNTPTPGSSTWTGGSGTGNYWSDSANWTSALLAGNSLAFAGSTRLNNTNDTIAATVYSNIVFNAGAGAFTLNGNAVTLGANVTNNSSSQQTINFEMDYNSSRTLEGGSGGLVINGGWNDTANTGTAITTTLSGAGTLVNNLSTPTSTNIFLTSASANWMIADNASSTANSISGALNIYNGGTLNFGTADSAPNLTLTGNDGTGNGQRQAIGNGTGTSTLNVVNGTLTFGDRVNVGNGTGGAALNISGGTLNVGGAGLSIADNNVATVGSITASGGLLHLSAGNLFVATRGSGTLTISGGEVDARTLDVSRNASGVGSAGVVNLNGGTLTADRISTATSSSAAGGSPTANFNFNGGTLKATSASATWFQGGNAGGTQPIPITATVKSGGALIDDGGNAITIAEPLQHDSSLGATADGGLTKLGASTLSLTATNTYTGDTTISAGTLALSGNGSISNSANISLDGSTIDASGRSDGTLTLNAAQTLKGNGTIIGNAILNGTISPGDTTVNAITNTGDITFGTNGNYVLDMEDASGQSGTNWDQIFAGGNFIVQSTSGNPFIIQLRSIDGDVNDGNPGAANFGNASAQSWSIAMATNVAGFASNKFVVDDSQFQNDLAGGYFIVTATTNSLQLTFVPNDPPVANDAAFYLPSSGTLQIPISSLAAGWSDPDGDPVQLFGINNSSANGINNISNDGNYIYYTAPPGTNAVPDEILYTINDVRTNPPGIYRPGDTHQIATGVIHILRPPAIGKLTLTANNLIFSGSNGAPNGMFYVLASTNVAQPLTNWTVISTNNFDAGGNFNFTNPVDANNFQEFYLLKFP